MAKFSVDDVKKGNLGMFSLIAGGLAVLLFFFFIPSLIFSGICCLCFPITCISGLAAFFSALVAIVLGIVALISKKKEAKGLAIGGIALGFLYFIMTTIFIVIMVILSGINFFFRGI